MEPRDRGPVGEDSVLELGPLLPRVFGRLLSVRVDVIRFHREVARNCAERTRWQFLLLLWSSSLRNLRLSDCEKVPETK